MRGEQEQACLNVVRKLLRTKDCNLYVDENDYIINYILTAQANEHESDFPDFIFDNGFIEHFQVSSAKETSKGSCFKQEESNYKRATDKACEESQGQWQREEFKPNTIMTKAYDLIYDENSYEYFVNSFKRNFKKHIESLKKCNAQNKNGIFLIEHTEAMLFIDGTYPVVPYRLFFDKDVLEYLYQFKDLLKYVVYTDRERVDVIKISVIPKIIQRIPQGVKFKAGRTCSTTLQCFIDLKL